jgi:hypothetical protein
MDDKQLQQSVIDELKFEPSIDAAHIGVTANDGDIRVSMPRPTSIKISGETAFGLLPRIPWVPS